MKPNLLPFIGEKWAGVPQPTARFDGKTIIITGANSGIGFEAAVKFVALGASKVILGVRSMSKGTIAARQIEERTQRKGIVNVWELDMGLYSSIQKFAARVDAELHQLDVAILNAGVTPKDYDVGQEGWQSTLQVNVLGTTLLALLLLPKLKESKTSTDTSRLVIVTSEAHRWVESTDIPDPASHGGSILQALNAPPSDGEAWDGLNQNAKSKLLAMYVARSVATLATQPTGEIDIIVSSVCPGACRSELARHFKESGLATAVGLSIYDALFSKTAEVGARSYISAAASGPESHGGWYRTTALTT
jgi:NAD(P)-dependent dehydrogenase (short-subunit alcohol dehydrogenase family)